jgi:ribose transport system permease protein
MKLPSDIAELDTAAPEGGAPAAAINPRARRSGALRDRLRPTALRDYAVVISFFALFIALSLSSDKFLTEQNLLNLLDQSTTVGIIACAGTLVIIAGGFDLSVGAIYALGGVVAAKLALSIGAVEGIVLGVLFGGLLGLANGLLVTVTRINPFIATLASSIVFRGIALAITGGFLISVSSPTFQTVGLDKLLGVRWSIWIFVVFAVLMAVLLHRTTFGRYVYACGGNPEAARLSGIRVGRVQAVTFVISGLAAALAGVLVSARIGTGAADAGFGLELTAVAAIVVGGTSIWGGEGAVWRTLVGVFFLALIQNGFNLLNIDPLYQQMVQGGIILFAAGIDAHARRTRR